jgi:catechol-2,3-dioxygenase
LHWRYAVTRHRKTETMNPVTIPGDDERLTEEQAMPPAIGLFEMVLEVTDLAAAERFYHDVIGLPIAGRWTDERPAVWLALGREGFL